MRSGFQGRKWFLMRYAVRRSFDRKITAGFGRALAILAGTQYISNRSTDRLIQTIRQVTHKQQVLERLENILVTDVCRCLDRIQAGAREMAGW